ncbi:MAG: hypothetical protein ACLFQV_08145 [Vulcanimicrobiota bacterium]
MEVHNNYIIHNSQPEAIKTPAKNRTGKTGAQPLTPGVWQEEMEGLLELFDGKKTKFSPAEQPSTEKSNTETENKTEKKEAPSKGTSSFQSGSARKEENRARTEKTSEQPAPPAYNGEEVINEQIDQIEYGEKISEQEGIDAVKNRDENAPLLKKDHFLKADHFPSIHKLPDNYEKVPEAPNYRKNEDEPIHGVGLPTINGIKNVLKKAGGSPDSEPRKKVMWTNMREEAVVYIDGRPFSLRDWNNKFNNMDYSNISPAEVEAKEAQLKEDIMAEAQKNGGYIVVHDEVQYKNEVGKTCWKVVPRKIKVIEGNLKTTRQVFDELKKDGYNVDYARIPITDEKRPNNSDFEALVDRLKNLKGEEELVFNCHQGKGRTTTSMVASSMLRNARMKKLNPQGEPGTPAGGVGDYFKDIFLKNSALREDIKEQGKRNPAEYKKILRMIKLLEDDNLNQEKLDGIIDKYKDLQDLKESVNHQDKEKARNYLERYNSLLVFNKYVEENAPDFKTNFSIWLDERPEQAQKLEMLEQALNLEKSEPDQAYA